VGKLEAILNLGKEYSPFVSNLKINAFSYASEDQVGSS
jgi:hypothetical protein